MATLTTYPKQRTQRNKHFVNEKSFVLIKYEILIEIISSLCIKCDCLIQNTQVDKYSRCDLTVEYYPFASAKMFRTPNPLFILMCVCLGIIYLSSQKLAAKQTHTLYSSKCIF